MDRSPPCYNCQTGNNFQVIRSSIKQDKQIVQVQDEIKEMINYKHEFKGRRK